MEIKTFDLDFSVCKLTTAEELTTDKQFYFTGITEEEISLICQTKDVPKKTLEREDGWKMFRIQGVLDFSLIGILSKISTLLADNTIGLFAISTFNTDYILVKEENFQKAKDVLSAAGYTLV